MLEQVIEIELGRPASEILHVQRVALDLDDADRVSELPLGDAFTEPVQMSL